MYHYNTNNTPRLNKRHHEYISNHARKHSQIVFRHWRKTCLGRKILDPLNTKSTTHMYGSSMYSLDKSQPQAKHAQRDKETTKDGLSFIIALYIKIIF